MLRRQAAFSRNKTRRWRFSIFSFSRAKRRRLFFALAFTVSLLTFYLVGNLALPAAGVIAKESNAAQSDFSALQSSDLKINGVRDGDDLLGGDNSWESNLAQSMQQGRDYYQAGQFAQAAQIWEQTASSLAREEDGLNQAMVLSNLSLAYQHLGQWTQAEEAISQSLNILTKEKFNGNEIEQTKVLAQALTTQGRLQLSLGQGEEALASWEQAADAYKQVKDDLGMLRSQINQAQALKSLGLYRRSALTLTKVRESMQAQPDSALKAAGLRSLGSALLLVGDLEQSQAVLEESLAIAKNLQLTQDISATLLDLGNTAKARQDQKTALAYYQQAAAIATVPITKIQAQLNQLHLLLEQQQLSPAQTLLPEIQSQLDPLPAARATIYARIDLALSMIQLSPLSSQSSVLNSNSGKILSNALQQAKQLGDQPAEAYALGNLGKLYEQTQQWDEAKKLTEQALLKAQAINSPDIAYRFSWQLGRLLKAQGDTTGAIAAYTEAVKTLQALRKDLIAISPDVQFSFTESVEPIYRQLVNLLLPPTGTEPSQQNLAQARDVIESLQLAELDNFFQEACLTASAKQIDQIDPTAAVIYPIILPDHLAVILSLPGQPLHYYQTQISQKEVETIITQTRQVVTSVLFSKERLRSPQQIYNWLIRPAEPQLTASKIKTLVFVLDGSLRNIPMAALHDGNRYLIETYNLALSPSLQLLDPKPLERQDLKALMAGLTQARQGFSPLENVAKEFEEIELELPTEILLDQSFTIEAFRNKLKSSYYPIVHIATHGQFSSKAEDTFVLTWDSRINVKQFDQILRPVNQGKERAIELLVLSACQTAKGDKRAALGLAGVAVRAGANSTLATLWNVSDAATAELMSLFYQELRNTTMNKAEALRKAQLVLLQNPQYQNPFYWAPFVLVGNWL